MCGLAGAFQQEDGKRIVAAMTDRLAHRGPDAGGIAELVTPRAAAVLGHRRLSIIDPTAGADQPFARDGLTLVYNGELYNFRELRRELEGRGVTFRTDSDTEVVVAAWRRWGTDALRRFRGMFALAVYDEAAGSLTLARDGLGIKPLYVLPRGDGVVFASELKALATALGDELRIDPAAMVASTLYYWVPPTHCSLQGVRQLPAGTWVTHHADGRTVGGTFWDPVAEAAKAAATGSAGMDLRAVVEESVLAHLVADVPVATFLSGGLDSSIITALAHRQDPSLEAYTIAFRAADNRLEAMPDDAHYARLLADHLGIRLHEIELQPDVTTLLPRMAEILDEPIGDPAAINTLLMCEAARDAGAKVLLSGMGADELFGGYRKHLACLIAARYRRTPSAVRRGVRRGVDALPVAAGGRGLRTVRWAQRFCSFADLPEEEAFRRSYTMYDAGELRDLIDPGLGHWVDRLVAEHAATYDDRPAAFDDDPVNRMCLTDSRLFMPGLNLTYTDRASMAASTEVRVPFVDREVFAAAFALGGRDKIRGRVQKAALKDAARAWLPAEIVDRPKASFGAPLRAWVGHDLREQIDDVLVGGELVSAGVLRAESVSRLVTDQRTNRRDTSKQLWQLLSLEHWYRQIQTQGVSAA